MNCSSILRLRKQTGISLAVMVCLCSSFLRSASAAEPPLLPPLSTVPGSPRLPGKFVWADLVTDDVAAARKFYGQLFGWTFRDLGNYTIAANAERPLGGIFHRPRPAGRPEATPRWFGYISVANIARAERQIIKSGGR